VLKLLLNVQYGQRQRELLPLLVDVCRGHRPPLLGGSTSTDRNRCCSCAGGLFCLSRRRVPQLTVASATQIPLPRQLLVLVLVDVVSPFFAVARRAQPLRQEALPPLLLRRAPSHDDLHHEQDHLLNTGTTDPKLGNDEYGATRRKNITAAQAAVAQTLLLSSAAPMMIPSSSLSSPKTAGQC
jgi:hypothetical protein